MITKQVQFNAKIQQRLNEKQAKRVNLNNSQNDIIEMVPMKDPKFVERLETLLQKEDVKKNFVS